MTSNASSRPPMTGRSARQSPAYSCMSHSAPWRSGHSSQDAPRAWTSEMARDITPGSGPLDYANRLWLKILFALTIFTLYVPILTLVAFSFNTDRRGVVWRGFTWDNYIKAWNNRELQEALINSLTIAILATIISTVIGAMLALLL